MSIEDAVRARLSTPAPEVSVGVRQRIWASGTNSIPASGAGRVFIGNDFTGAVLNQDDGFYYEALFGSVVPGDSLGFLTITDINLSLAIANGASDPLIELATPVITTLVPRDNVRGSSLIFSPPGSIFSVRDLVLIANQRGLTVIPGITNYRTFLSLSVTNSDAGGPHSMFLRFGSFVRSVRSMQEP